MKITKIELFQITFKDPVFPGSSAPRFQATYGTVEESQHLVVKILTDEEAVFGLGEGMTFLISAPARTHLRPKESIQTMAHVVRDLLAPHLISEDPLEIDRIHYIMEGWVNGHTAAKSAIDMAIHDIAGKHYGVPVCKLLGGCYRTELQTMGGVGIDTPEEMAREAAQWAEKGFRGIQVKLGGMSPDPDRDVQRVRRVREAVGDDMIILADANQAYSPGLAIRALKRMERYGIYAEQPTPASDFDGLARVARSVEVPILADESVSFGGTPVRNVIRIAESGAAAMLKLKDMPLGGIHNQMKVVRIAEAYGLPIVLDTDGDGTRVLCTALAHVGAALNDKIFFPCVLISFLNLRPDIVKEGGIVLEKDIIKIGRGIGLGVEVDEGLLSRIL